jgi:hypothetical protein
VHQVSVLVDMVRDTVQVEQFSYIGEGRTVFQEPAVLHRFQPQLLFVEIDTEVVQNHFL